LAGIVYPYVSCMIFFFIAHYGFLYRTEFFQMAGGVFHPVNDIGLGPSQWMLRGDNYVSAVAMAFLFFTLITTAFVNTYGCEFRHSIVKNRGMMVCHGLFVALMGFLFWSPPNRLNCVFRVNCDTKASLASGGLPSDNWFNRAFWETLTFWSAGGLGDCFLGPTLRQWCGPEGQWFDWYSETTGYNAAIGTPVEIFPKGGGPAVPVNWLPVNDPAQGACYPDYLKELEWRDYPNAKTLEMTDKEDELITGPDVPECEGPNNCFPLSYKMTLTLLVLAHVTLHHLFLKGVLHGPFVERLRRRKDLERQTEMEMQQRGARSPLIQS